MKQAVGVQQRSDQKLNKNSILEKTVTPPQPPNHLLFAVLLESDRFWKRTAGKKRMEKGGVIKTII